MNSTLGSVVPLAMFQDYDDGDVRIATGWRQVSLQTFYKYGQDLKGVVIDVLTWEPVQVDRSGAGPFNSNIGNIDCVKWTIFKYNHSAGLFTLQMDLPDLGRIIWKNSFFCKFDT